MSTESIITIFSSLAFGPALAVVLLRWVLSRAVLQDERLAAQATELGTLRARVDELEGAGKEALARRLDESVAQEARLVSCIDRINEQAGRLASVVAALDARILTQTCQLPADVLAKIRDWMRDRHATTDN